LGLPACDERLGLDTQQVRLASVARYGGRVCLAVLPGLALTGSTMAAFLRAVAPHGSPEPSYLLRAYALPDLPFPSVLLKEHEAAPAGLGDAYMRFNATARRRWVAALQDEGPGLHPAIGWVAGDSPRFLTEAELAEACTAAGLHLAGIPDGYLGRGLLLLARPATAAAWNDLFSLGPPTKERKITGREFPVWVTFPAHEAALLRSPVLAQIERLLENETAAVL